ncbi:MAG: PQQ-binding-like beta-propeller repeat protein [Alphaproteobacteria bacterium]|nr:PQQ-binding-like beta-propeller repeat protein [Alphaproteobacteria bacterium]
MGLQSARALKQRLPASLVAAAFLAGVGCTNSPTPETRASTPSSALEASAEALFQKRCASCHEPNIERAPSRSTIALMSPEQIVGALDGGVMAPMTTGLSKADIEMLADHLGSHASSQRSATSASLKTAGSTRPVVIDPTAAPVEWLTYNGGYASTRYSPLDQINKDNVKTLHVVWRQSLTPDVPRGEGMKIPPPSSNNETTPLMAGGLVYFSTGIGGVAALDAATGKVVWNLDSIPTEEARSADDPAQRVGGATRALSYWADGGDGRIIALIGGRYLAALDAKTGKPVAGFGVDGQVDLRKGQDSGTTFNWRTGPTVIVRGVIIIGSVVNDINAARGPQRKEAQRGDVRGIDAKTGKQLWIWHSIPQAGEDGNETWLDGSWKYTGHTNVWGAMSADEDLGLVYMPETTPTNDWYGGKRPGADLFAESIVALDARTGKRVWHFQGVHHGLWDYDFPCAPVLVDITVNDKKIKALAQPSKQAFLYVLDRETGKPVWPIVERPVPQGDAPGEWYSPTQPVPLNGKGQPFAYDQQGVTVDDLIDFTPELRAEAKKMLEDYAYGPMFFPVVVQGQGKGAGKKGSIHMPGSYGGTNWPGAAFDPETNILYVPSAHTPVVASLVPAPDGSDTGMTRQRYEPLRGPQGLPMFKPPYGRLVAIDLNKGEIKWTVANGDGPRDNPALKGLKLPPLGVPGRVGPLATKTLVFMGEGFPQDPPGSGGKMFRAFDKATGDVIAEIPLDGAVTGVPMTYAWQGRQYIIVPMGYPGRPGEFVALTVN